MNQIEQCVGWGGGGGGEYSRSISFHSRPTALTFIPLLLLLQLLLLLTLHTESPDYLLSLSSLCWQGYLGRGDCSNRSVISEKRPFSKFANIDHRTLFFPFLYKVYRPPIVWCKLHKKQHVSAFFGKSVLKCFLT